MPRDPLCQELLLLPPEAPVDYAWDDWKMQSYFNYANNDELDRFKLLTGRANIALALACCEWVEARFRSLESDPELSYYIDAGWAGLLDKRFTQWIELRFDDWQGPVRSPMLIAMGIINEAYFESDDNSEMAWRACYAVNLARYVLPDGTLFEEWLAESISRLESFHSWKVEGDYEEDIFAAEVYQGSPVAREIFDKRKPYTSSEAQSLLRALVLRMDRANPFLHLHNFP